MLLAAAALADGDPRARFKEAYRKDTGAEQRRAAILELAAADVPEAAAILFDLWPGLERDAAKLRSRLFVLRETMRELRAKLRDPRLDDDRKRTRLLEEIQELNGEDLGVNAQLAAIEIEQDGILEGIGLMKSPEVVAWLASTGLREASSPLLVRAAARRVAASGAAGVGTLLQALERVRRSEDLIPLLQALGERGEAIGDGVGAVLAHLSHKDWAVRVAAAYALARAARPEGVGPLVRALGQEKAESRARDEIARCLTLLTGQKLGNDPEHWAAWWRANEAKVLEGTVELGKGRETASAKGDQGHFYGIPQVGRRILYVVDVSGSMEVSMTNPKWVDGRAVAARDDETSRFDAAVKELLRATRQLRRDATYAVIFYASHASPLHDDLVAATPENHAKLEQMILREGPGGSTNIYEAMDLALRMANVHPDQKKGAATADSIYLLSDGSPTDPEGKTEDPERTLKAVAAWNGEQRVAIFTIGIGREHNAAFLRRLAEENGGAYFAVK